MAIIYVKNTDEVRYDKRISFVAANLYIFEIKMNENLPVLGASMGKTKVIISSHDAVS